MNIDFSDLLAAVGLDIELVEKIQRQYRRLQFNKKQQLEFIEDFETWLEDSGNVRKACDAIIVSKEETGDGNKPEAKAAREIRKAVVSGQSIAEGMRPWFDNEVITVFATGEKSEALKDMVSDYMKLEEELAEARAAFRKVTLYPTVVFVMLLFVCIGFANFLLPQFLQMAPIETWPIESRVFLFVYGALGNWIQWIVLAAVSTYFFLRWYMKNGTGVVRRKLQHVFPFSIYTYLNGMRVVKMMGLLVGKLYNPRKAAFEISRTATPYLKWHLNEISQRESSGEYTFAQSFNTGLMPLRTIQRMEASSAWGDSDSKLKALKKAGERSGREAFYAIAKSKRLMSNCLYGLALAQMLFLIFALFSLMLIFIEMA